MRISDWSSDVCSSDLPSTETMEKIDRIARANAAGMAALRDMPLGSAARQGAVQRLREARNAALEEAAKAAIHNSNFGHVEGKKLAYTINAQNLGRQDVQPNAEGEKGGQQSPKT